MVSQKTRLQDEVLNKIRSGEERDPMGDNIVGKKRKL